MMRHDSPARNNTKKPEARISTAVPRSGWRTIKATGTSEHDRGHHVNAEPRSGLVAVEVPGQRERHRDLHELRRLDARYPHVQPAPRAVHDLAEQRDRHEQQYAYEINRQRERAR